MSHGKPNPMWRRHNLAEVDAHNSTQIDRLLHPLLRQINEIPADTSQNERDRVAIDGEKNENHFLSLPFRAGDDYFLQGAFGQESRTSGDSDDSAETSHQSRDVGQKPQESIRTSAAFDILRPEGKFTSATLGQATQHQGKRGHHRKKVFMDLEKEKHIREQATRPTDLARTSRLPVRDAEARHRPNKKLRVGGLLGERADGGGPRSPSRQLKEPI